MDKDNFETWDEQMQQTDGCRGVLPHIHIINLGLPKTVTAKQMHLSRAQAGRQAGSYQSSTQTNSAAHVAFMAVDRAQTVSHRASFPDESDHMMGKASEFHGDGGRLCTVSRSA